MPAEPSANPTSPPSPAQPRLSIIIPMYNAERTIERTLRSLLVIPEGARDQVQIILVNDGSTDRSPTLARETLATANFPHAILLDQANGGSASARNAAIRVASGEWLFFLDADDELLVDPLHLLSREGGTSILFSVELLSPHRRVRVIRPMLHSSRQHWDRVTACCPQPICAIMFRRAVLDRLFEPNYQWLEDWHFWMVNARVYTDAHVWHGPPLARIHVHPKGKTASTRRHGRFRERIASDVLAERAGEWTATQRNNLHLQIACGRIQQGLPIGWRPLTQWPCTPTLYLKLLCYLVQALRRPNRNR